MAQLPQAANTEGNDETAGSFEPIPAGQYTVAVVKSEMKETKAKTGHYLNLQFKVQEGDFAGRVLFDMLNLINPNPVAVEIANKKLNALCAACGLRDVEDSEEFHGVPFQATVGVEEATADWPAKNKMVAYLAADLEDVPF